jgi:hypothetical protein
VRTQGFVGAVSFGRWQLQDMGVLVDSGIILEGLLFRNEFKSGIYLVVSNKMVKTNNPFVCFLTNILCWIFMGF